jgi:hypothetical protein
VRPAFPCRGKKESVLTRACCRPSTAASNKQTTTELHVYDKDKNYVPFDAQQPETFFEVQRKVIPNSA